MTSDTVTSPLLSQAYAYLQDGDPESAELLIQTFLDRNPDDAQAHHVAGLCRQALGDSGAARDHLQKAASLAPEDPGPAIQLAMLMAEQSGPAAALVVLEGPLEAKPGDLDLLQARSTLQRRAGDIDGAVASAQMAYAFASGDAHVNHTLGLALVSARNRSEARDAFKRAVDADPSFVEAWINLGVVEKEIGNHEAALESYSKAIELQPDDAVAHNNFGNLRLAQGDIDGAMAEYSRAIDLDPDYVDAKVNLALAYREAGDPNKSLSALEEINREHPDQGSVLNSLGNALRQAERFDEGRDILESAIAVAPEYAEAYNNLGLVLTLLGQREEARAMFERTVRLRPDLPVLANNYGTLLLKMFLLEEAIEALEKAVELDPAYGDAWVNLGVARFMRGHYDDAIAAYRQVIDQQPDNAFAHYSLGVALIEQQDLINGSEEIQKAIELDPGNVMAVNTLGVALLDQHRIEEARDAMAEAAASNNQSAPVYASNHLFTSLYLTDISNEEIFDLHCRFGKRFASGVPATKKPHTNDRTPGRKLKLGYMSPDFRGHSVAYFIEALLEKHDRTAFEIILYSNTTRTDLVTEAMQKAADTWVETAGLTEQALVDRIRDDKIDVLVDLGGHTSANRLVACGYKPAPVQIGYLGYPDTTGMPAMDFRITDERADPSGEADERCIETLMRLPHCFHCYRPHAKSPDPSPAPHREKGYVTFGSFNVLPKLNAKVVDAWAEILSQVPDSRLFLKCKQLKTESVKERVLGYFAERDIERDRIDMVSFVPAVRDHLNQYARVDLALDTFPYNGTTTTCEAIWMGVPVLTSTGFRHTGRVGLSLLHAIGLDEEFCVPDTDAYIAKAIELGRNPERLADLRSQLRNQMAASPLRDEIGFTRDLESLYRRVWTAWCEGPETYEHKPPAPLKTDDFLPTKALLWQ